MKRFLAILLAVVMVITGVTAPKNQVLAEIIKKEDVEDVTVSKSGPFTRNISEEASKEKQFFKVTAQEEGVYIFESTGDVDTIGYIYSDVDWNDFDISEYVNRDDSSGEDENFKMFYYLKKGESIYFMSKTYHENIIGEYQLNVKYDEKSVGKNDIVYVYDTDQDNYAVYKCQNYKIENVVIEQKINGKNVEEISCEAFENCKNLIHVTIPEGIIAIYDAAFSYTALESINIPESCEYIGNDVFVGTNIEELDVPKNVTTILSLGQMERLKKITVAKDNEKYVSVDGVLYTKDKKEILAYPIQKTDLTYTTAKETVEIGYMAFFATTNLKKIILSENVKTINSWAFEESKVYEVVLNSSLETVENNAFFDCENLKYIDFPESVNVIGHEEFGLYTDITLVIRNSDCELKFSAFDENKVTIYGKEDSTAQQYAEKNENVKFIQLDPDGCNKETPSHQMVQVWDKKATCKEAGVQKQFCVNCKAEGEDIVIKKLEHNTNMCKNYCEDCKEVVNKESIRKISLGQDFVVKGKDFESGNIATIYGFEPKESGKYQFSYDEKFLDGLVYFILENSENNYKKVSVGDGVIDLTKGAKLWILVRSYYREGGHFVAGSKLKMECCHEKTVTKITNATCQKDGKKEEVCTTCGEAVKTKMIPKLSHSYDSNNKCTKCGETKITQLPTTKPTPVPANKTVKVGKDTYILDGNGQYVSKTAKKSSVSKVSKGKKSIKVTWKKISGVNGYQVQYCTSKKFTKKTTKTKTYSGNKKFTKTIKKLKSKKTYYVRVRAYRTTKVSDKSIKVYTSWSKAKSVKTK